MAGQGIEPGPLTLESDALPIASGGPAQQKERRSKMKVFFFCSCQVLYCRYKYFTASFMFGWW